MQDWDMIYPYDYGKYGDYAVNDAISDYFDNGVNPAKASFFPSIALAFREGKLDPSPALLTLTLAKNEPFSGDRIIDVWKRALGKDPDVFAARFQTKVGGAETDRLTLVGSDKSSARSLSVKQSPTGAQFAAVGSGFVALVGYIGAEKSTAGPITIECPHFGDNFASLTLAARDDKPVSSSSALLLTITGKAVNVDMKYNQDRTSVGKDWGHGPVLAEGIPGVVTIANTKINHVWAQDSTGKRTSEVPGTKIAGGYQFTIDPKYCTVWYEMTP
jgi:hypothetical protein